MTFDFDDLNWSQLPAKKHAELHLVNNELWWNTATKTGALVCKKGSKYDEVAVSQTGLDYLHTAVQTGKIPHGIVVLAALEGRRFAVVKEINVAEIFAVLSGIPPREGQWGFYWWVNIDGTSTARHLPDDDIPF